MESSGPTLFGGLGSADLPAVAALFERPGPFASVYLNTPAAIENAAQHAETAWKNVRRDLAESGVLDPVLDQIGELVPDAHLEGETLAVIANADGVLLRRAFPDPPARELWRVAPLPVVGPLIAAAQELAPHLIVLADRAGADLVAVVRGEEEANESVADQNSSDPDLRKSKPGGWSQRRYQQRAEDQWDRNAKQVADRVVELFDEIGARLVVVAGDVRALEKLRGHLPERVLERVQEVDGSRAVDGGVDALADEAVRAVATAVASDSVALLDKLTEELGQNDRAAEGPARTLEALAGAQVDTLLIADDPDDTRTAWFAADGPANVVGFETATVKGMGVDDPQEARLVDVCLRAAFGTGAGVRIVPSHAVRDGVAAILRFTTTPGS
jgi:peptide subunit release factor 1 (eRF1)